MLTNLHGFRAPLDRGTCTESVQLNHSTLHGLGCSLSTHQAARVPCSLGARIPVTTGQPNWTTYPGMHFVHAGPQYPSATCLPSYEVGDCGDQTTARRKRPIPERRRIPVKPRNNTGFVAYAQAACDCRPGVVCSFCRAIGNGHPKRARKSRQRRGQTRAMRVGYRAAHARVQAARGRASSWPCAGDCGGLARDWAYDGTDSRELTEIVNGSLCRYSLSSDRYLPLCRRCHRKFDAAQRAMRVFATW